MRLFSSRTTRRAFSSVFLLALWAGPAGASTRQKTDVVYMKNGDRITCEIKNLEYAQLTVKAAYSTSTFTLDWAEVERIESPQFFVVSTQEGVYYTGTIHTDAKKDDNLKVETPTASISLSQREIVNVGQYGRELLDRIKFAIDYGFSFARSNDQTQSTLHSDTGYRSDKVYTGGTIDSLFSSQSNATSTNRHQGSAFYYRRLRESRWYGGAFGSMLTNDSQDLALRTNVGAGVLRNITTTNRNSLYATAGLSYTNERYTTPAPDGSRFNSLEAVLGARYSTFRFDKAEFVLQTNVYPSLSQPGRVRAASDVNFYLKIVGNLYTRLGIYSNLDTHPPTDTRKHDYGVSTSIGWSF